MDLQSLLKHLSVLEAPAWPRRNIAPCFRRPEDIAETEREDLPQGLGLLKALVRGQQPSHPTLSEQTSGLGLAHSRVGVVSQSLR